jgi:hypothetical protein
MTDESQITKTPEYAKTMAELRAMPDDELVRQYDAMVTGGGPVRYVVTLGYYLDELRRRDAARQTAAAIRLAQWTLAVAVIAALAAVFAVIIGA